MRLLFFGTVPTPCVEQILRVIPFDQWKGVHLCCSGTFKLEQAIHAKHPDVPIYSNDVSLWTNAIGSVLTEKPIKIIFRDKLQFIEDKLNDQNLPYIQRVASVLVAQDMARYIRNNPYSKKHWDYYVENFDYHRDKAAEKLQQLVERNPIKGYFAGDWRDHVKKAAEKGYGIAAFPPFFYKNYETEYKFIHNNIDYDEPDYDLYNPKELGEILNWIDTLDIPYIVLSDQLFDNRKPMLEHVAGRKVPHYCYSNHSRSSLRHIFNKPNPFLYKVPDASLIKRDSVCSVTPAEDGHCNFIKDIYLAKGIIHSTGLANYFIWIDNCLAGLLVYGQQKYGLKLPDGNTLETSQVMYLLSDTVTSRDFKLSKLLALLSFCRQVTLPFERRHLIRAEFVVTTARSKNPSSMKYRDIMLLTSRREFDDPAKANNYVLQYGQFISERSIQDTYTYWFDRYSGLNPKARNNRNQRRSRRIKASN